MRMITYTTALGRTIPVRCYAENWKYMIIKTKKGVKVIVGREVGFEALDYIIDNIKDGQKHGFDKIILLTGEERSGKSTVAAHIATRLGFTDPAEVAFDGRTFWNKLEEARDYQVVWYDEAARGLYRRDWMDKFQRRLTKSFTQIGIKKLTSIICLPHRKILDSLMERRVSFWGHVVTKGSKRGWVEWMIPKKNKFEPVVYWKPLFVMRFPKFREADGFSWQEYEKLKRQALQESFYDDIEKPRQVVPYMCHTVHMLKRQGKTAKEISELTGLKLHSVWRYLRRKDDLGSQTS